MIYWFHISNFCSVLCSCCLIWSEICISYFTFSSDWKKPRYIQCLYFHFVIHVQMYHWTGIHVLLRYLSKTNLIPLETVPLVIEAVLPSLSDVKYIKLTAVLSDYITQSWICFVYCYSTTLCLKLQSRWTWAVCWSTGLDQRQTLPSPRKYYGNIRQTQTFMNLQRWQLWFI